MPGNLAAVNLVPRIGGAIIVLTNSLALNDTAHWIGELLLETYIGVGSPNDYVSLAKETAHNALQWDPRLLKELQEHQVKETVPKKLEQYGGTFYKEARTFMIKIYSIDDRLKLAFQDLESEVWKLNHYHDDTFTWLVPRNEFARRGRFTNYNAEYFKIMFGSCVLGDDIDHFTWWHDKYLRRPQRDSISRNNDKTASSQDILF